MYALLVKPGVCTGRRSNHVWPASSIASRDSPQGHTDLPVIGPSDNLDHYRPSHLVKRRRRINKPALACAIKVLN